MVEAVLQLDGLKGLVLVRIFEVHMSSFGQMCWEFSLSKHVPRLKISSQTSMTDGKIVI